MVRPPPRLQTIVSVPQFATYRSGRNFAQPDSFIPERWLGAPGFENDNRDAMNPFSTGPRNCMGKK